MTGQLALRVDPPIPAGSGSATLSCFHRVAYDAETAPRGSDNWPNAIYCPDCRRRRAVVSTVYPTPSDAIPTLSETD